MVLLVTEVANKPHTVVPSMTKAGYGKPVSPIEITWWRASKVKTVTVIAGGATAQR